MPESNRFSIELTPDEGVVTVEVLCGSTLLVEGLKVAACFMLREQAKKCGGIEVTITMNPMTEVVVVQTKTPSTSVETTVSQRAAQLFPAPDERIRALERAMLTMDEVRQMLVQ